MNNLKHASGPHNPFVPSRLIDARWLLGSFALSFILIGAVSLASSQRVQPAMKHEARTQAVQTIHGEVKPGKVLAPTLKYGQVNARGVRALPVLAKDAQPTRHSVPIRQPGVLLISGGG